MKTKLYVHLAAKWALVAAMAAAGAIEFGRDAQAQGVAFGFGFDDFGRNGLGRFGLTTTLIPEAVIGTNLAGKNIVQVDAGGVTGFLLASDGTVFSFGHNLNGRTGLGFNTHSATAVPTPLVATNFSGKITQVSAGYDHTLLLDEHGTAYSIGGELYGQTGLNQQSGVSQAGTSVATPIVTTNLGGRKIKQVEAGHSFSLLLAEDGTVFTFGHIGGGVGGVGGTLDQSSIAIPINMAPLAGHKITAISAGGNHSLLLSEDGVAFSMGFNLDGATGQGTPDGFTLFADPVDTTSIGSKKITQVAAGDIHGLLLAEDGSVYSFGQHLYGRTGLGTEVGYTTVATPIDLTNLNGRRVTKIAAGGDQSFLLTADGMAFSFGRNLLGATGRGTDVGNTLIPMAVDTTNLAGLRVIDVASGTDHSLLLAVPVPEPNGGFLLIGGVALAVLRGRARRLTR